MRCTTLASTRRDDRRGLLAYAMEKGPPPVIKPSCSERGRKEVAHGWTGGQSGPDYGRWRYERHWSSYGAQAGNAGRRHCLDRSTAAARGSAAGRDQEAVAWH